MRNSQINIFDYDKDKLPVQKFDVIISYPKVLQNACQNVIFQTNSLSNQLPQKHFQQEFLQIKQLFQFLFLICIHSKGQVRCLPFHSNSYNIYLRLVERFDVFLVVLDKTSSKLLRLSNGSSAVSACLSFHLNCVLASLSMSSTASCRAIMPQSILSISIQFNLWRLFQLWLVCCSTGCC